MKLLEKETPVVATPVVVRPVERPPVERTTVQVRARMHVRQAPRRHPLAATAARTASLGAVVGAVYVVSTLMGYVALERARQSYRHGAQRAAYAQGEAKLANESINDLTNPTRLREWALGHGFVAGAATEAVVARR